MGLTPPELQRSYGVFYESFTPSIVRVSCTPGSTKAVTISWNAPAVSGSSYRLYGSLSPTTRSFIGEYPGSPITLKVPTSSVIVPPETPYHFWVSVWNGSTEMFLEDRPALVFTAEDKLHEMYESYRSIPTCNYNRATIPYEMLAFYRDEIRRRHVATLEIGGESFYLYKRRIEGKVCEHCLYPETGRKINPNATDFDPTVVNEVSEPRFQGRSRCEVCFGTGIVGGFYFPIEIKVGHLGAPTLKLNWKNRGVDVEEAPDSWTLWSPIIKQHDLLYRKVNGNMYVVKSVKTSTWQQSILRQTFNIESIDPDDMQVRVTRDNIKDALDQYGLIEEEIPLWLF